jgi:hypothetical protein
LGNICVVVATDLVLRCFIETCAASYERGNAEPLAKHIKNDKTEKEINTLARKEMKKMSQSVVTTDMIGDTLCRQRIFQGSRLWSSEIPLFPVNE